MKLIIFDLDQTLVDLIAVHDEVTRRLFRQYFNVDAGLTEIDFAGKSLTENLYELARMRNVAEDDFRKKSRQLLESYDSTFIEILRGLEDIRKHILPGVEQLLNKLLKTEHILALYTGDSPAIVEAVLKATNLGRYFKFCLYGTEVEKRADMVKLAVDKARNLTGRQFTGKDIVIIGDSTKDVECGKQFNALTVAVVTGFHTREQLSASKPDYIFPNLENHGILQSITGS
jgi:phosphoglycolate phosphatase